MVVRHETSALHTLQFLTMLQSFGTHGSAVGERCPEWVGRSLHAIAERLASAWPLLAIFVGAQLAAWSFLVLLFIRFLQTHHQVGLLKDAIADLAHGDRSARCAPSAGPLSSLSLQFNDMATVLANELRSLRDTQRELEQLVATDRLTGIGNRRHFEQQAEAEVARANRYRVPTSMILFDVDNFKRINDRFGHQVGDAILVTLTRRVAHRLRDTDCMARWGGEEFAILTPCTPISGAENLAEKIRTIVAEEEFEVVGRVTISLGVAQIYPGETAAQWIARADQLLYEAKRGGRNRSCSNPVLAAQSAPFILVWGEQFLVDHAKVDSEHAEIVRLANEITLAAENSSRVAALYRLDQLLSCVFEHFQSEEAALADLGCPAEDIEHHAQLHLGLVAQFEELRSKFAEGRIDVPDVADFVVRRVAIGHLVGADLPLFASLTRSATMPIRESQSTSLRDRIQRAILK